MGTVAASWIADPSGRHQLRYWDGETWTEHVSDGGVQSLDPEGLTAGPVVVATTVKPEPLSWEENVLDDIEKLAKSKLNVKTFVRKELKTLPALLGEAEQVLNLAQGTMDKKNGIVVVTDRRILFYEAGAFRRNQEDFPYERVSSVQTSTAVLSGKLTIYASGNQSVIENVMPKERVLEIGNYVRARISSKQATPPSAVQVHSSAPTQSVPTLGAQIRELADLRDQGILSEDEFQSQKSKLLA